MREVVYVCDIIRRIAERYGQPAVDGECGLHIHFDANGMTPEHLGRLFSLIHMAEPIIYSMYPSRSASYCAPLDVNMRLASRVRDWTDVRDMWYRGSNNIKHRDKVYTEKFINSNSAGDHYDGTRYHGFNIHCFWRLGTMEFRYGRGTIDGLHIKSYYDMCLAMMNTAMSDKPLDIPDSILKMKYDELKSHYFSNYRLRKYLSILAKTCGFSRDAIRLITDLVRDNNPHLLSKKPKFDADDEFHFISGMNSAKYVFRVTNPRRWFDGKYMYINHKMAHIRKPAKSDSRKVVDVKLVQTQRNNILRIIAADRCITFNKPFYFDTRLIKKSYGNSMTKAEEEAFKEWMTSENDGVGWNSLDTSESEPLPMADSETVTE
jgi:hypothetical protein